MQTKKVGINASKEGGNLYVANTEHMTKFINTNFISFSVIRYNFEGDLP